MKEVPKIILRQSTLRTSAKTSFMASTPFSLEVAKRCLDRDGFFDLEDSAMGEYVLGMEQRGFPYISEYGLDFCKKRVLDDAVSRMRPLHNSYLTLS
jgi:hypothetical protein